MNIGGKNQYAPLAGIPELREQIALKTARLYGRAISMDDEITIAINQNNFQQVATDLKLLQPDDHVFNHHQERLRHALYQVTVDKTYYDAAKERVDTGLQTLRADLEFSEAERERGREIAEAQRENRRNWILGLIGVILGLAQIWPILHDMAGWPPTLLQLADALFVVIVAIFTGRLLWLIRRGGT
jgi:hypothetical protein